MECINYSYQKQTCLFSDRLFLACLFVVRLMYRECIANIACSQFFQHCISAKNPKQITMQQAICFFFVCLSVGFALVCFFFACLFNRWGIAIGLKTSKSKGKTRFCTANQKELKQHQHKKTLEKHKKKHPKIPPKTLQNECHELALNSIWIFVIFGRQSWPKS